jgi:DNA-binding transcriptional ArsR family regulator
LSGQFRTSPPIYGLEAELFRALGHPARIRLLQLLRVGEHTVGALRAALGLDSSSTSQQLAALRKQGLVEGRREGTSIYYRVKDRRTLELLELAKDIIAANLEEGQALLDGLAGEDFGPPSALSRPGSGSA